MKISGVHIPDAASDPKHPDHDRWVKDRTLRMEVEHATRIGGTARDAERENQRLLARMEQLAQRPSPAPRAPRKSRRQRMLERAVEVREALPRPQGLTWLSSSPCGRCGVCRACMRERRILKISHLATKQKEPWAMQAMWQVSLVLLRCNGASGEFRGLTKKDAQRKIAALAEKVCDESVRHLGRWI